MRVPAAFGAIVLLAALPAAAGERLALRVFEFRSLPSGEYEVRAVLKGSGNQTRAVTREQVRVIASGAGS